MRIVGGSRDHNFTLIFAASNTRGMIHHEFFERGTNVARFNAWLRAASEAVGNGNAIFNFYNASCHHRFAEAGLPLNHDCKLLPAYSPFLNICENCFSAWKAGFKRQMAEVRLQQHQHTAAQRQATLMQLGAQNLAAIMANSCENYFRRITTYLPAMVQLQHINDHQ